MARNGGTLGPYSGFLHRPQWPVIQAWIPVALSWLQVPYFQEPLMYEVIVLQVNDIKVPLIVNFLVLETSLYSEVNLGSRSLDCQLYDMKSARNPVSISAHAGCPLMWTTTTRGFSIAHAKSFVTAAFRWSAGYFPTGTKQGMGVGVDIRLPPQVDCQAHPSSSRVLPTFGGAAWCTI